ncbi:MAG: hypothetical protein QE271_05565 [Bacteriovoracaceae bacterium]|nr:hypothetical protein [Bacteriovoracaceae bacterium]
MKHILLVLFLMSCVSSRSSLKEERFLFLDRAYMQNYHKEDVEKEFGAADEIAGNGIIYNFQEFKYPQIGVFFDANHKIKTSFYLAEEKELNLIKKSIPCNWIEVEFVLKRSHYFKKVRRGECKEHDIKFQFMEKSNNYEFRWGKNQ